MNSMERLLSEGDYYDYGRVLSYHAPWMFVIGARGLGETVLLGLQRNDSGQGAIGGLAIVALAIVFDRVTQSVGLRLQSRGTPKS